MSYYRICSYCDAELFKRDICSCRETRKGAAPLQRMRPQRQTNATTIISSIAPAVKQRNEAYAGVKS